MSIFVENERGNNFSAGEIGALKDLLQKYGSTILSKKTDALGSLEKEKAWTALTREFNASTNVLRTTKQLKYKWEYIKRVARKEAGRQKQLLLKTGGGPPPPPMSDTTEWVSSIMKESIVGISSTFDGDSASNNVILGSEKILLVEELTGAKVNTEIDVQQLSESVIAVDNINQDEFTETPSRNSRKRCHKKTPLKQSRLSICTDLIQLKVEKIEMEINILKEKNLRDKDKHTIEMENLHLENKKRKLEILILEKQL